MSDICGQSMINDFEQTKMYSNFLMGLVYRTTHYQYIDVLVQHEALFCRGSIALLPLY
jgi:hypothetical protein